MRSLLRRALAIAVSSSVMFSTLGWAHAPCDAMATMRAATATVEAPPAGGEDEHAGHAMRDRGAHVARDVAAGAEGDCERAARATPAERGTTAPERCLVMADGATMLPVLDAVIALESTVAAQDVIPLAGGAPMELAREPEPRPPRA